MWPAAWVAATAMAASGAGRRPGQGSAPRHTPPPRARSSRSRASRDRSDRRPQTIAEPAGHLRATATTPVTNLLTANPRRSPPPPAKAGHDRRARMQEAREIGVVVVLDMRGQSVDKSRHRVSNGNCVDLPGRRHGRGREPCTYPAKKIVYIQYVNPTVEAKPKRVRVLRLSDIAAAHVRELIVSGSCRPASTSARKPSPRTSVLARHRPERDCFCCRPEDFSRRARRGFSVTALSSEDVRDIYDAQAILGGELTARAARVIGPELVTALRTDPGRARKRRRPTRTTTPSSGSITDSTRRSTDWRAPARFAGSSTASRRTRPASSLRRSRDGRKPPRRTTARSSNTCGPTTRIKRAQRWRITFTRRECCWPITLPHKAPRADVSALGRGEYAPRAFHNRDVDHLPVDRRRRGTAADRLDNLARPR